MTSHSKIPSLLSPYILSPPNDSLILLTNTLGTSANWLVIRYLCGALSSDAAAQRSKKSQDGQSRHDPDTNGEAEATDLAVVLVSWVRDFEFWRTETRRAAGIDLAYLAQSRRFAFVDGLTSLYSPSAPPIPPQSAREIPTRNVLGSPPPTRSIQPVRRSIIPNQGSVSTRLQREDVAQRSHPIAETTALSENIKLSSTNLQQTQNLITKAIDSFPATMNVLLILDAPDLLLALQPDCTDLSSSASTSLSSLKFSLRLHEKVHSTILNLSADINAPSSTLPPNHTPSPMETESQAFLIGAAHQADLIIGCRGLDTGGAGDVSGVLRITTNNGSEATADVEHSNSPQGGWSEQELLYLVRNDGTAKVWERGGDS
ncbi:hypothetical protein EJ08DRAFT_693005 [Tothia fuscella]|uniref:Uncharacterized protein n=1 Tax=Tothia fuscella TaxID=1048955 RepID=A0A9P4NZ33_9PEZI|nr:hypothetical protein EJ08DRAFT_693005 [Tothia fuscella]